MLSHALAPPRSGVVVGFGLFNPPSPFCGVVWCGVVVGCGFQV